MLMLIMVPAKMSFESNESILKFTQEYIHPSLVFPPPNNYKKGQKATDVPLAKTTLFDVMEIEAIRPA